MKDLCQDNDKITCLNCTGVGFLLKRGSLVVSQFECLTSCEGARRGFIGSDVECVGDLKQASEEI